LGSEINSEGTIEWNIDRTQNICKFGYIMKGIMWKRELSEQCQRTIYKVHFKHILTYNSKTWALKKENRRQIQAKDINCLSKPTEGETRWNRNWT
jgi:hypothetical protein